MQTLTSKAKPRHVSESVTTFIWTKIKQAGPLFGKPKWESIPKSFLKLLCSGAIIKGSFDFVVKWLWLAAEWQALIWTLIQSDMCNRSQDLITSVAISSNSDQTFHTHSHLKPWHTPSTVNANTNGKVLSYFCCQNLFTAAKKGHIKYSSWPPSLVLMFICLFWQCSAI